MVAPIPDKRQLLGAYIYEWILRMIGEEHSPKVCGMIISLDDKELFECVSQVQMLEAKVREAHTLIIEEKAMASRGCNANGANQKNNAMTTNGEK